MRAQEMERKLHNAAVKWAGNPSNDTWQDVLSVVYDYAGDEYDTGYESGEANARRSAAD